MKVLLTGASGFVGSHVLDSLRARQIQTAVLLRPSSDRQFIARHLPEVEVRLGSITDPPSLGPALAGITHVIHCAGCTRAKWSSEYVEINHLGTRNMVEAVNAQGGRVKCLLHVSSLAVAGPATAEKPARESDPPAPVSEYGRSKLAGELEVRQHSQVPFVIIRPPAVYGPRDNGFLSIFRAVARHVLPRPSATQSLSLVFGPDLAEVIVSCLGHPAALGKIYFAAADQIVTGRMMADEIATQIVHWTLPCPLPAAALWPVCVLAELFSRVTGKASLLNRQKFAELRAPGWVCDPSLVKRELGCACPTALRTGVASTLSWYREAKWL
jgi:nucleoside-diphosphate-sugar epimerase